MFFFVGLFLLQSLKNSCFGVWWLAFINVLASESVKRKTLNFRLKSVAQEHLCLNSLTKKEKARHNQNYSEPIIGFHTGHPGHT